MRKMRCYYDLLRMDANMPGLTKFLLAEITESKFRDRRNAYIEVAKHQWVGILKSFIEPSGKNKESEAYVLPVIEAIADFLVASMNEQMKPKKKGSF